MRLLIVLTLGLCVLVAAAPTFSPSKTPHENQVAKREDTNEALHAALAGLEKRVKPRESEITKRQTDPTANLKALEKLLPKLGPLIKSPLRKGQAAKLKVLRKLLEKLIHFIKKLLVKVLAVEKGKKSIAPVAITGLGLLGNELHRAELALLD